MGERAARRRPGRERVLATADRLFYTEGINSVGVDRIASEADVSKATLYANFASKDALAAEYLRQRGRQWREFLAAQLEARGSTPADSIVAVFDILTATFVPGYGGCPFIKAEAERGAAGETHLVNLEHRHWLAALFEDLARRAALTDPHQTAGQLCMAYDGAMVAAAIDPSRGVASGAVQLARAIVASHRSTAPSRTAGAGSRRGPRD